MKIKTQNLSFTTGKTPLLSDVNLTIYPGKMTGILGPNGAGKSTLLRILAGLLLPTSGQVTYDTSPLSSWNPVDLARRRAYLSQSPKSAWSLSVYDVVALGRLPHTGRYALSKEDQHLILSILQELDLLQFTHRPIDQLSVGEQARVYLARTLATDAPVLFLDEPTSAFDFNHQDMTLNLLKQKGRTAVVILHDLIAAQLHCDEIIVLRNGVCVGHGATNDPQARNWLTNGFGGLPAAYYAATAVSSSSPNS